VTADLLRRDVIASSVVTSFMRRAIERPDDPWRAELYDVVAEAGANFIFDRAYGDAHTETGVDIGEFFGEAQFTPCAESRAALRRHLPELLAAWRARVTRKGSSSFFGVLLRHLGPEAGEALAAEWGELDADERFDLLERFGEEEALGPGARRLLVEALLDPSMEARESALRALAAQDAPVEGVDASAPDRVLAPLLPALREWAAKTKP